MALFRVAVAETDVVAPLHQQSECVKVAEEAVVLELLHLVVVVSKAPELFQQAEVQEAMVAVFQAVLPSCAAAFVQVMVLSRFEIVAAVDVPVWDAYELKLSADSLVQTTHCDISVVFLVVVLRTG